MGSLDPALEANPLRIERERELEKVGGREYVGIIRLRMEWKTRRGSSRGGWKG